MDELIEYLRGVAENANLPQYMRDRLTEAAAALEAAREDGARLDWLADQMRITDLHFILDSVPLEPRELRAAIDQARRKTRST